MLPPLPREMRWHHSPGVVYSILIFLFASFPRFVSSFIFKFSFFSIYFEYLLEVKIKKTSLVSSRIRSFLFWIKEIGEEFQNPFHLFHDTIRRVAAYIKEDAR